MCYLHMLFILDTRLLSLTKRIYRDTWQATGWGKSLCERSKLSSSCVNTKRLLRLDTRLFRSTLFTTYVNIASYLFLTYFITVQIVCKATW